MTNTPDSNSSLQSVDDWASYLAPRLRAVHERLKRAGGDHVTLLAVSKGQPVEAAQAAVGLGLADLGENYAQELAAKAPVLQDGDSVVRWHFIGQLQTNKVRTIADVVSMWQSVDRAKTAREIAKRTTNASALVQVNLSAAENKGGCTFDQVEQLVEDMQALDIDVRGLMGVGEADDVVATAAQFARLRGTCDRLSLPVCSMGMSADLEMAIESGSTMVRIGSDIFGPRVKRAL